MAWRAQVSDFWPHSRHLDRVTVLDDARAREPYYRGSGAVVRGSGQIKEGLAML